MLEVQDVVSAVISLRSGGLPIKETCAQVQPSSLVLQHEDKYFPCNIFLSSRRKESEVQTIGEQREVLDLLG